MTLVVQHMNNALTKLSSQLLNETISQENLTFQMKRKISTELIQTTKNIKCLQGILKSI